MAVEGDHHGEAVVLAGVGDGLPDDLLMAEMDAVKDADGQADLAAVWPQFVGGVDEFHQVASNQEHG